MDWKKILQEIVLWISTKGVRLLLGLIALFILFKITNVIASTVRKRMEKRGVEKTIYTVTYQFIRKGFKILFFILFLSYVGIDTAGVGAIVASAGVAIGLALQGSLANLAGGLLIILLRPFRLGDYIAAQGAEGTVEEISIFYSSLATVDNKVVLIPNGALLNGNITNFSRKDIRRLDLTFSIEYEQDFITAEKALKDVIAANELILKSPEPFVAITEHGESAIKIITKSWVKTGDYWTVYYQMLENVKKAFDEQGINIPYNHLDVRIGEAKTFSESKKEEQ